MRDMDPLPEDSEEELFRVKSPDLIDPRPEVINTEPPFPLPSASILSPPCKTNLPLLFESTPLPTPNLTLPAIAPLLSPEIRETSPDGPF
jgi:hypothetical protein